MKTNYKDIGYIADNDVVTLIEKGNSYGDSWCKRGGVGAFMMLARKWDRIENQAGKVGYDIFRACGDTGPEGILDDIADLRCYLLLVEERVRAMAKVDPAEPAGEYVNQ